MTRVNRTRPASRYDCTGLPLERDMNEDRQALMARRKALTERLEAIKRDLGRGLEKDYEEQSIQLENLEVLQEIYKVTQQEISNLDRKIQDLPV